MDSDLKIVVDGIIYQFQSHGGLSRIFSEILPRICNLDDSLHITLLTEGKIAQSLPKHPRITRRAIPPVGQYLRPGRVWEPIIPSVRQLLRGRLIRALKGKIWHSTYYTLPENCDLLQVVTVADMIYELFVDLFDRPTDDQFREQKRLCVKRANAVISISETTRQDIERFYGLDSSAIYIIPLACSDIFRVLDRQDDDLKMQINEPFLLYVGTRYHYKNFEKLIRAYSLWKRKKEVPLVVAGRRWSAYEEKLLVELRIKDQVHLLTDIDDMNLCQLYNQAAAFVYPSLYEGFGIPLLEAMSCGCPIVASYIPSTIEVAGAIPIYFKPSDVDDIVNALDVAMFEGRNSERVRLGLERVKKYSWDKTAAKTLDVYRTLKQKSVI